MIGLAIRARLNAHAGTLALTKRRVHPLRLPQGTAYPAVRYQVIGAPRTHAMGADTGEVHARVQVDSYAETYDEAQALAKQVRLALSRWDGTAGGVVVDHIFLDGERDMLEPTAEFDGEQGVPGVTQDYIMHYQE